MRSIESTPSEQRYLTVHSRISDVEWKSTVSSVLQWLNSEPDTMTEAERTEMREIISAPLTPTQIPVFVIACYADIPNEYEWNVVFDLENPENHQVTSAVSRCGIYFRRAVLKQLDDGHHAAVVLDFPNGVPAMVKMLPEQDNGNLNMRATIGFCTDADYQNVRHSFNLMIGKAG